MNDLDTIVRALEIGYCLMNKVIILALECLCSEICDHDRVYRGQLVQSHVLRLVIVDENLY